MDLTVEYLMSACVIYNEHVNHVWCAGGHTVPAKHLLQQIPRELG